MSLFSSWFGRKPQRRPAASRRSSFRPALESLEDRTALSTVPINLVAGQALPNHDVLTTFTATAPAGKPATPADQFSPQVYNLPGITATVQLVSSNGSMGEYEVIGSGKYTGKAGSLSDAEIDVTGPFANGRYTTEAVVKGGTASAPAGSSTGPLQGGVSTKGGTGGTTLQGGTGGTTLQGGTGESGGSGASSYPYPTFTTGTSATVTPPKSGLYTFTYDPRHSSIAEGSGATPGSVFAATVVDQAGPVFRGHVPPSYVQVTYYITLTGNGQYTYHYSGYAYGAGAAGYAIAWKSAVESALLGFGGTPR